MQDTLNSINLVFICDENYVVPTIVAITSIYKNKNAETRYSINILAVEITESSKNIFYTLNRDKFYINIIEVDNVEQHQSYVLENLHVSPAAIYKFNIPNYFPDLEKILYLDGDILVQKDLSILYNIDISDVYAGVIKDMKPMQYNPPQVTKLKVNHTAYFNSGVMLLNLKKMRKDNIVEKLFQYRKNGINFFMDQDALNVVFKEQVLYLSLMYNMMTSVISFFTFEEIAQYYSLAIENEANIYSQATILHLCTKYKPWSYNNVPFSDLWKYYYDESPKCEPLRRNTLDVKTRQKIFKKFNMNLIKQEKGIIIPVIISLTSYPARIGFVSQVIDSLFNQSIRANKIILWLAESQFPHKENQLPQKLIEQKERGLDICWCDDIKPHKKYFYTMQEYPDSIIITVDDDVKYSSDLVETLLESYIRYPYAVSAMRAHLITFDNGGDISPYCRWKREFSDIEYPSLALCATGVGGVLYPPRIMRKETFDIENIRKLSLYTDDLWLKIMQVLNYVPVVVASKPQKLNYVKDSQNSALWQDNDIGGGNDIQLKLLLDYYNCFLSKTDTLIERIRVSSKNIDKQLRLSSLDKEMIFFSNRAKVLDKEIKNIQNSLSYRIGRFITFIPRKIRGGIRCYKEHGMKYTLYRVQEKMLGLFRRKPK